VGLTAELTRLPVIGPVFSWKIPVVAPLDDRAMKRAKIREGVEEYRPARELASGLMLAALDHLPHFSVSSMMSLPKSAGEPRIRQ
jgi:hypothetical protein